MDVDQTPTVDDPSHLLLLLTFLSLLHYPQPFFPWTSTKPPPSTAHLTFSSPSPPPTTKPAVHDEHCDLFKGDWVPDPNAPYYTNETCLAIHDHQNCMKYGRPDRDFLRWRWKPAGCDLPVFDPSAFLELMRGKSMAFVGDSLARNHMQSLLCLLTAVGHPVEVFASKYFFPEYNFNLTSVWSQFLVRADSTGPDKLTHGSYHLHLDEPDSAWTVGVESFDYLIVSVSRWFFRPNYFYERNRLIGCNWCQNASVPEVSLVHAYARAFRTTFAHLNGLPGYRGTTFLRSYSTSHYENGGWDSGGDCTRTSPRRSEEIPPLEGFDVKMYNAPVEEFRRAKGVGAKRGLKYHLLDVTRAMVARPDGHPSRYGHPVTNASATTSKDCVHWCLPGPIDSWNSFLLEILRRERSKRNRD